MKYQREGLCFLIGFLLSAIIAFLTRHDPNNPTPREFAENFVKKNECKAKVVEISENGIVTIEGLVDKHWTCGIIHTIDSNRIKPLVESVVYITVDYSSDAVQIVYIEDKK